MKEYCVLFRNFFKSYFKLSGIFNFTIINVNTITQESWVIVFVS